MSSNSRPPLMPPLGPSSEVRDSGWKRAWPFTPNAVSKLQQCKRTMLVLRMSIGISADPMLDAIGGSVMEVLDVTEQLIVDKDECTAFAETFAIRTTELLRQAESATVDKAVAEALKSFADEIKKTFEQQATLLTVSAVNESSKSTLEFDQLHNRLDNVLGRFKESLDANQHCLLLRAVRPLASQASVSKSAQVPSDLPIVQLPPAPQIFFGRDDLVKSIVDALLGAQTCRIPILGPGGIGKTSVASAVLNNERIETKYGRHRIFVSCEGAISALDIVNTLAAALGVLSQADPTNALLGYLRSLHCAILLVLDNLETAWDSSDQVAVGQLLAHFCGVQQLSLIITMRGEARPMQVKWTASQICHLPTLDDVSARRIFIDISGTEEAGLDELLKLLEGLPLAITLMAYQGQMLSPTELLVAYKAESTRLLNAGGDDRLSSLEVSIRLSLNCFTMRKNPHAQQLLSLLSVLPDGISSADLANAVPSMANRAEAARILTRVGLSTRLGLVLRVLAPIRDFMLHHSAPQGPYLIELQTYFMQMTSLADDLGTSSGPDAIKALTQQFGNIHAVLMYTWATWPSVSPELDLGQATLNLAEFSYLSSYGDCTALLNSTIVALRAPDVPRVGAARLSTAVGYPRMQPAGEDEEVVMYPHIDTGAPSDGQWLLRAEVLLRLGLLYQRRYRYNDAVRELTAARAAFDDIGNRHGAAHCLQDLGEISRMQARYDDAVRQLTEASAEFNEIGDRFGAAQCLQGLGEMCVMQARYDDAVRQFTEAQATLAEFGDRLGVAQCLRSLGNVSRIQDRYDDAVCQLTEARTAFDKIGDRLGVAQCVRSLGDLSRIQARYDDAVRQLTEARAAFTEIGDRLGVARCLHSLGDISRMQARYDDAVRQLTEARAAFDEIGSRLGAAQCLQSLGDISCMQDRYDDAVRQLTEARTAFDKIGDRPGVAQCVHSLGNLSRLQARYDDAVCQLTEARAAFTEIGDRLGVAHCVHSLGDISRMQDRYDDAVCQLTEACAAFNEIGDRRDAAHCLWTLGDISYRQHRYEDAVRQLAEAQTVFQTIGDNSHGIARCNEFLGYTFTAQCNVTAGRECLQLASRLYKELGCMTDAERCRRALEQLSARSTTSEE